MSAHTPGPWVFKREVHKGDVDHIATVAWVGDIRVGRDCGSAHLCNYESHGSNAADARLIAAAPDLLEALRKAVVLLAGACVHAPELDPHDTYEAVSAAIAKATGAAA